MSFKTLLIFVPVVALAALTGCGPSCEGLCDDAQEADCHDNEGSLFDHGGCYAICQEQEDMEDDDVDDCTDEFDDLLTCMSDTSDICDAWKLEGTEVDAETGRTKYDMEKCSNQFNDYANCVLDYCEEGNHDKRDYCS
jgi:hypothetical protein